MSTSRRIIIDADPGVDDALALLLAIHAPQLDIQAVTVVSGNVPLSTGTQNALDVLAFAGVEGIPVYQGADRPLVREPVHAREVHGARGLGAASLPASIRQARAGAVDYLVAQVGEGMTVVALGPLTNLALAERDQPGLLKRAKEIVVMGGAVLEPGNASPTAEYNFFADPHAAREVLASGANLTLVPLDVTHQIGMTAEEIEGLSGSGAVERVRFFQQASSIIVEHGRATGGFAGIHLHDPVAVGWVLAQELFETGLFWMDVETDGTLTSGQVVVDRRRVDDANRTGREIRCVMGGKVGDFITLFLKRALGLDLEKDRS